MQGHLARLTLSAAFALLSIHCSSRGTLGFEANRGPIDAGARVAEASADPPGFDPIDTAEDAGVTMAGCHIATLGNTGIHPSDIFTSWLDKSGAQAADGLKDQVLTQALLSPYKMLVIMDVSTGHPYSETEATVLQAWVEAGGGLMALNGYGGPATPEAGNVNRLLARYGMSFGTTLVLYAGPNETRPISNWAPHPISTGITKVGYGYGYEVLGSGSTIAWEDGHEVLKVKDFASGHVLLWGDEWISFNTEWSAHPDYQVQQFWQNIVDWFAPGSGCKVPDPAK